MATTTEEPTTTFEPTTSTTSTTTSTTTTANPFDINLYLKLIRLQLDLINKQARTARLEELINNDSKSFNELLKEKEIIHAYNNLFSEQTYNNNVVRNENRIGKDIEYFNNTIEELKNDPLKNKMDIEIYKEKLNFNKNLLELKNNSELAYLDYSINPNNNFNTITIANILTLRNPIITGSIETLNGIKQPYTIDATGADPDRGTTNLIFGAFPETDEYVTSGTYDHKTGLVDLTWNVEPPLEYEFKSKVTINSTELAIQRNNIDHPISNNNKFETENFFKTERENEINALLPQIANLKAEINKTALDIKYGELFVFSNYEINLLDTSALTQRLQKQAATSEYIKNRNK